jgi:hypothetical protein
VSARDAEAVLEVFGIVRRGAFHVGRMAVPGGMTYLVVAPPAGERVAAALDAVRSRYDPRVVVLVGAGPGRGSEVLLCADDPGNPAQAPVTGAVSAFFAAVGEPATLPGFGGAPPFPVRRGVCAHADGVRGRAGGHRAWAVVHGVGGGDAAARNAAQALRYLVPYLRPRL